MFISKLTNFLEQLDPYYTQRIILHKGLYLAVWLTAVNWIAQPNLFTAYCAAPMLLAGGTESSSLSSFAEKDKYLVTSFLISGCGCSLFYLLYPYKFWLLCCGIGFFLILHYLCTRFFPKLKPFIMTCVVASAINMSTKPAASIQVAIDMFFCMMLSLLVTFIAFKLYPNHYRKVWHRAFILYVQCVKQEIIHAINKFETGDFAAGAGHLNMIRAYRHLLPREKLINFTKVVISMRNINFSIAYLTLHDKDELFWFNFKQHLEIFEQALQTKQPCPDLAINLYSPNQEHKFVNCNLTNAIKHWNKICMLV